MASGDGPVKACRPKAAEGGRRRRKPGKARNKAQNKTRNKTEPRPGGARPGSFSPAARSSRPVPLGAGADRTRSALAGLEARVLLVDHVHAALAAHDAPALFPPTRRLARGNALSSYFLVGPRLPPARPPPT